jgi:hypothetical protein
MRIVRPVVLLQEKRIPQWQDAFASPFLCFFYSDMGAGLRP